MTWDARKGTRKREMLQVFSEHKELRPDEYASIVGFYPARAAWSYLRRYHRGGMLRKGRDWKGRIVYRLAANGARWLLWFKRTFPDEVTQ
jgi:hypothetical protein